MNRWRFLIITLVLLGWASVHAERLKDISSIQGIRTNQLVGYGLVVGLEGTGDGNNAFTTQSFRSMLKEFGITVPSGTPIDIKNVAAVAISAQLPPFLKPGQKIDITVSSIGSAKSLRGGSLLMTPLKGADGQIYAIAQGNLLVSGFGAEGADGSKIAVNITSVGRIPNGATVERVVPSPFYEGDSIVLNLYQPDFTTAKRVVDAINRHVGPLSAKALDSSSIKIMAPIEQNARVDFVSVIENIYVDPDNAKAKIVVNSRTGTIVIGQHVVVKPAAISHGSLTVTISENPTVSQPTPLSNGTTVPVANSTIKVTEGTRRMFYFKGATTLNDIVRAVNAVGAAPGDLMAVLEAMKQVGALSADLEVI